MAHCFQFLDRDGTPISLAKLDDEICRDVLGIEPDPDNFSVEFNRISLAVSTFEHQPDTLLRALEENEVPMMGDRESLTAVLLYLIDRGITAKTWRTGWVC